MPESKLRRAIAIEWLGVSAALLLLTFGLSYFNAAPFLSRLDQVLYDFTLRAAVKEAARDDIVLVAIDDNSLAEIGYWPWQRSVHARLLSRLAQAKAVGMDILFNDENPAYPDADAALAREMAAQGHVVLPMLFDARRHIAEGPLPILARSAYGVGRIDANPDNDGVIRSVVLHSSLPSVGVLPHFALAMMQAGGAGAKVLPAQNESSDKPFFISYIGGPQSFPMYTYAAVLNGRVPESAFKDKYVLVGAWASGLNDALPTPFSGRDGTMAGVEILANVLQNALNDSWIRVPGKGLGIALTLIPVLLACAALRWLSPRHSIAAVLAILVAIIILNWLLMSFWCAWIPPAAAMVGVVLAYPVWNWRSQEAALRYIDRELEVLHQDRLLRLPDADVQWRTAMDQSLSARVIKLHRSVVLLRQAVRQREEVLRFISHDMRSPQNSILALTEMMRRGQTELSQDEVLARIERYAYGTLGLVDGFVHLARAEIMQMNCLRMDLVDLVASVCDERWPLARKHKSEVQFHAAATYAYANVDGGLVSRAIGNLLDNAIQYSPQGSIIRCEVARQGRFWRIAVHDQGPGIEPEQRDALFAPFIRLNGRNPGAHASGSGLGLPFVQTVMLRHDGSIECESVPGQGSIFIALLPANDTAA